MCSEDIIHFSYLGLISFFSEIFLKKYHVYAQMIKEKIIYIKVNVAKDNLLISVFTSFLLLPSRQLLLLSIDPSRSELKLMSISQLCCWIDGRWEGS